MTFLNQCYWVGGASIGGIFGSVVEFNAEGLEFVMTALLVVIFLENWIKEKNHTSSVIGAAVTLICLIIAGPDNFIIISMAAIILILTLLRNKLTSEG